MAVAILIHDYDFIGNSGANLGCIPKKDGKYFEILKIDPGEALTLQELIAESKTLHNPLNEKGAIVGTLGERINFEDLNEFDQREFIQTLKEVLEVKASKLEEVFLPFFEIDKKFRTVFEELLNRRKDLLYVFTSEVTGLIDYYITKAEEKQAKRLMANWSQPSLSLSNQMQEKAALIRDKAQLEAYTAANDINSTNTKVDQTSPKRLKFVGRASELSQIKEVFSAYSGIVGCAIVGMAGFGKSQLASEYIRKNQKEMYSCVLWLHSEQSDLILDQIQIYLETCFNVKINSGDKDDRALIIKTLYEILSNQVKGLKKACIIFDSAESMSQIADCLPDQQIFPNLKLDILVTSRYKEWDKAFGKTIELQAFGPSETKNYIKECFSSPRTSREDEQLSKDAERLNSLLGGLPLAISLAVSYIQQKEKGKEMSISEFCNFLTEGNKSEAVLSQSKQITETNQESEQAGNESKNLNYISTILTLALADLRSKNHNIEYILDLMAYLSPDGISITLLKDCWKDCRRKCLLRDRSGEEITSQFRYRNEKKGGAGANMINPQGSFFVEPDDFVSYTNNFLNEDFEGSNSKDFDKALELMFLYSIIAPDSTELIQKQGEVNERKSDRDLEVTKIKVHQLTQQVIQLNHRASGVSESCHENVFRWVLNQLHHDERDPKEIRRAGLIVTHAKYLEHFQNDMVEELRPELLEKLAISQLDGAGEYNSALENLEKALRIDEKYFGRWHPKIAFLHDKIGFAWGGLGNYQKKKDSLTSALEILDNIYGKDHLHIVGALNNLGVAWGELGDYEKYKDFVSRAFKICEKHYGINHPRTGSILANLANAWGQLGDFEKNKDLLTRALEINEKHYGKDHHATVFMLFSLGNTWGCLGNYEKQKDLFIRALKISEEHYGRAHPKTGVAMASLGKSWGSLGDYEKQKNFLIQGLEIIQEHYGNDHPQTCEILEDLAFTWGKLGNYERKKTLLTQILEIYEQRHGNDHPRTVYILKNLAFAWGELGDYEMKRDLFTHLLEIYEQHHGSDHPKICEILEGLSDAWGELGDYERKKDILIRAYEICEAYYDDYHPITAGIMAKLADVWNYFGNYEEAQDLLVQALFINEFYAQGHSAIGSNLMSLGDVYFQMGDFEDALDSYSRAYKIFQEKFGETHKHTIDAASKLKKTKEST